MDYEHSRQRAGSDLDKTVTTIAFANWERDNASVD